MIREWMQIWQARNWMKRNESFLSTWHAYVGYKLNLFEQLHQGMTMDQISTESHLDRAMLSSWVDVGLAVGQLKNTGKGIQPSRKMLTYASASSPYSVGALLQEMMELHFPTLLYFPVAMQTGHKVNFNDQQFAPTVAETSSYLERLAFPQLNRWVQGTSPSSILDIGCGQGGYLMRLAQQYRQTRCIGLERNATLAHNTAEHARKQGLSNCMIIEADIDAWPDPEQTIDMVMLNNILYYFNEEERRQLLARIARFIGQRGSITMITPLRGDNRGKSFAAAFNTFMVSHRNLHSLPSEIELRSLASDIGFRVGKLKPIVREGSWFFVGLTR
jgi:SAM-dependent methyltransferase